MTLYRAVRFYGGSTLTFDGITFEADPATDVTHNGYDATIGNTFVPAISGDKDTFMRNIVYRDGFTVSMANVPAGDYEVYLYIVEDDASNTYGLTVGGINYENNFLSPVPNEWQRRGPFPVTLSSTGTITVTQTGSNYIIFAGMEVHAVNKGSGVQMINDYKNHVQSASTTWVDVATIAASQFIASHKYLILASAIMHDSGTTADHRARLVYGTTPTEFTDANLSYRGSGQLQNTPMSFMTVYTQPGTTNQIKLQISQSSTSGTARAHHTSITAIDLTDLVENTDYWFTETTTDQTTTTTMTAGQSITFTANGSDTYLVFGDFTLGVPTTTSNYYADLNDSVAGVMAGLSEEGRNTSSENRRELLATTYVPASGSHTIALRLGHEVSIHTIKSQRLFVLRLNAFDQFAVDRQTADNAPGSSYANRAAVSVTPDDDRNWFVFSYLEADANATSQRVYAQQLIERADVPNYAQPQPNYVGEAYTLSPRQVGWDADDIVPFWYMAVAPLEDGNARDISLQTYTDTGSSLRTRNHIVVAFSSALASGSSEQTITAPNITTGEVMYGPTLTPGTATVSPPLFGAPVLYTPTMQPGYVQILANFISTGEAVYTPDAELSPPGAQTITAPLVPTGEVLYTPNVGGPLSAPLIADTGGVYSPMLASGVIITLGSLIGGPTIYSPTTVPGNSTILAPLRGSAYTLYVAQLLSGMSTIQTPQIGSYEVVFTPTGNFDLDVTITMNEVVGGPTVFVPESSGGTQVVKPGVPGLFRIGLDLDGDRWVDWEGRYDINLIPAAVWFDYLPHGEVNATVTDRHEKSAYGLIVRTVEGVAADAISYTRLGTNITPAAPVQPSTNYTIVVWARSRLLNPSAMLQLFDQDGIGLATGPEQIVGSTWTKFRYVYTTPSSGVTGLQVGFARSNTAPTDYEFELTGWGVYSGVTTNDFNSGALPGQPFPSLITEDITRYVIDVSWDSGTKGDPAQLTPIDGEISIKLNNVSQDWTPRNAASPYYDKLHAHTIIEVQVDEYGTGDWRQLWTGFFSDITITTGKSGNRQAIITGRQGLEELSMLPILYAPKNNQTATQILLDVMTEAEVPADRYSWILGVSLLGINTQFPERQAVTNFDDSTYVYPVSGVGLKPDATVRSFFDELVRNEGGFAFYDRLGRPSFRTRNALVPGLYDEEE